MRDITEQIFSYLEKKDKFNYGHTCQENFRILKLIYNNLYDSFRISTKSNISNKHYFLPADIFPSAKTLSFAINESNIYCNGREVNRI